MSEGDCIASGTPFGAEPLVKVRVVYLHSGFAA